MFLLHSNKFSTNEPRTKRVVHKQRYWSFWYKRGIFFPEFEKDWHIYHQTSLHEFNNIYVSTNHSLTINLNWRISFSFFLLAVKLKLKWPFFVVQLLTGSQKRWQFLFYMSNWQKLCRFRGLNYFRLWIPHYLPTLPVVTRRINMLCCRQS